MKEEIHRINCYVENSAGLTLGQDYQAIEIGRAHV